MKYDIKVTELTYDEIVYILSVGLTGSYWAVVNNDTKYYNQMEAEASKDDCIEDILAKVLLDHKLIYIIDSEEDKSYPISLRKLKLGLEKFFKNGGERNPDNWDFWDGDAILQYACFGEVIYG